MCWRNSNLKPKRWLRLLIIALLAVQVGIKAVVLIIYHLIHLGLQTLGEEYVNIFQIHKMKPAPKSVRWILILLRILVPYIVQRSKAGWANIVTTREAQFRRSFRQNRRFSSPDQPSSGSQSLKALDTFIGRVKRQYVSAVGFNPLPALESIHLALFYIYGKYPHVFTRVTSIQYRQSRLHSSYVDNKSRYSTVVIVS